MGDDSNESNTQCGMYAGGHLLSVVRTVQLVDEQVGGTEAISWAPEGGQASLVTDVSLDVVDGQS